jgi:hypothetical protein
VVPPACWISPSLAPPLRSPLAADTVAHRRFLVCPCSSAFILPCLQRPALPHLQDGARARRHAAARPQEPAGHHDRRGRADLHHLQRQRRGIGRRACRAPGAARARVCAQGRDGVPGDAHASDRRGEGAAGARGSPESSSSAGRLTVWQHALSPRARRPHRLAPSPSRPRPYLRVHPPATPPAPCPVFSLAAAHHVGADGAGHLGRRECTQRAQGRLDGRC